MEKEYIARVGRQKLVLRRDLEEAEDQAQTVEVPLVGTAACGMPLLAEENLEGYLPVSTGLARLPHKYFLLRVVGDSMNLTGIEDGDLVLVRQQPTAENGDRVVALVDGEATVKELYRTEQAVILKPRSKSKRHKPIILTSDFLIQGVVIATVKGWK